MSQLGMSARGKNGLRAPQTQVGIDAVHTPETSNPPGLRARMGLDSHRHPRTAYLASFPPRECGIATFTRDLAVAIETLTGSRATVAAMNDGRASYAYDERVRIQIARDDRASYRSAAHALRNLPIDVVNVQHEYGLFGGEWGEYLLEFYRDATQPIVTTLHTTLPQPDRRLRQVTRELAEHSARVVVLAESAVPILTRDYGVPRERIRVIPHGVPSVNPSPALRERAKARLGYAGRLILSTFGLINPNKGIEYALHALPSIAREHPNVLYLIVGETHPGVRATAGENYREQLQQLVRTLHLGPWVEFQDRYLTLGQVVEYLQATDVYVVPYLDPHQIVSGTVAYAVGAGRAVVASPFAYAQEVLADRRGVLVPFRDSAAIASAVNRLLSDPAARSELEQRAYAYSRGWTWPAVGTRYLELFAEVVHDELPAVTFVSSLADDRLRGAFPTRDLHPARSTEGVHAG